MATRSVTTSGINGGYNVAASQGVIDTLKVNMASGKVIYASDINSLISLWNSFNGHTHGISDLYGIKNFGNTNPSGYSTNGNYENDTTDAANLSADISGVGQGSLVYAAKVNELVTAFRGRGNHSHTWADRTS